MHDLKGLGGQTQALFVVVSPVMHFTRAIAAAALLLAATVAAAPVPGAELPRGGPLSDWKRTDAGVVSSDWKRAEAGVPTSDWKREAGVPTSDWKREAGGRLSDWRRWVRTSDW